MTCQFKVRHEDFATDEEFDEAFLAEYVEMEKAEGRILDEAAIQSIRDFNKDLPNRPPNPEISRHNREYWNARVVMAQFSKNNRTVVVRIDGEDFDDAIITFAGPDDKIILDALRAKAERARKFFTDKGIDYPEVTATGLSEADDAALLAQSASK